MKLHQHESSVRDLEAEKESLAQAHSRRVQELEEKFAVLEAEAEERELAIREELAAESQLACLECYRCISFARQSDKFII